MKRYTTFWKNVMQVYQFCLGLVNLLVIRENDDNRAERLVVLHQIQMLLLRAPDLTVAFVRHVLPHAVWATLCAIGGNGQNRRAMDDQVAQLFDPYRDEYIQVLSYKMAMGTDDDDDAACDDEGDIGAQVPIYGVLGIGPDIPFRYDTTRYMDLTALPENSDNYYIFARAIESLCAHRFGTALKCDRDLGTASQSEWFSAWAKVIDQWDNDFALVILKPSVAVPQFRTDSPYAKRLRPILSLNLDWMFTAILHRAQIDAIRDLLAPYRMEEMIQVYSYALEMI